MGSFCEIDHLFRRTPLRLYMQAKNNRSPWRKQCRLKLSRASIEAAMIVQPIAESTSENLAASSGDKRKLIVFITEYAPAPACNGAMMRTKALFDVLLSRYDLICILKGSEEEMFAAAQAYPQVEWILAPKRSFIGGRIFSYCGSIGNRTSFFIDHYLLGCWSRTTRHRQLSGVIRQLERNRKVDGYFIQFISPAWLMGKTDKPVIADVDDDLIQLCNSGNDTSNFSFKGICLTWRNFLVVSRYRRKLKRLSGAIFVRQDDSERFAHLAHTFYAPNHFGSRYSSSKKNRLSDDYIRVGMLGACNRSNNEGAKWLIQRVIIPSLRKKNLASRLKFIFAGSVSEWIKEAIPEASTVSSNSSSWGSRRYCDILFRH